MQLGETGVGELRLSRCEQCTLYLFNPKTLVEASISRKKQFLVHNRHHSRGVGRIFEMRGQIIKNSGGLRFP